MENETQNTIDKLEKRIIRLESCLSALIALRIGLISDVALVEHFNKVLRLSDLNPLTDGYPSRLKIDEAKPLPLCGKQFQRTNPSNYRDPNATCTLPANHPGRHYE